MEPLSDPLGNRVVKTLIPPPHRELSNDLLYPKASHIPSVDAIKLHLTKEGRVSKAHVIKIIDSAKDLFQGEPNLLRIEDPVLIIGDVHGQFYDLLKILEMGGSPTKNKFLFLGDYVDRGHFSIEVVILLYCLKLNFPDRVFLIRGNHECMAMTSYFSFRAECMAKYDLEVYERFLESFDCLPLAALVNDSFIACHGGLSPEIELIDDIDLIFRFSEPPKTGAFTDLLWADPVDNPEGKLSDSFSYNTVRGCSYYYGVKSTNAFLQRNDLISVIRAHEVQLEGYKMHKWNGEDDFPAVITIFSAPNYCDTHNNKGAIVRLCNSILNIQQFNYSAHPYYLPDFMDVFTWSTPFVIEKVMMMLFHLLKPDDKVLLRSDSLANRRIKGLKNKFQEIKKVIMQNKVKAVSRMMKMYKTLREEFEIILMLKDMCPDNKIPRGLLLEGRTALMRAVDMFRQARVLDLPNERRPE
ncbi:PPP3CA_2 [Blepharisma stoltei]|uniref:Serine/threonine-protein phosphatase n=1 Tax=Blepharisma stoltei TaxID=1481888 RepID=A0AAU9IA05_9CILI|nr:unnamed protein product [Blepharisma stoltei]